MLTAPACFAFAVLCRKVPVPEIAVAIGHALQLLTFVSGSHPSIILSLLPNLELLQSPVPGTPATFFPLGQLSSQAVLQGLAGVW